MSELLRVGLDGRTLEGNKTGVGVCVFQLCRSMADLLPDTDFFVYSRTEIERPVESHRWHYCVDPSEGAASKRPIVWLKTRLGKLAAKDNLDVFWAGGSLLPRLKGIPSVLSVYDLNHLLVPGTMMFLHRTAHRLYLKRDILRADRIITCSEGTADRINHHYGRPGGRAVIPGLASRFKPASINDVASCLEQWKLTQPYLLSVATWEPRKNLESLVRAFLNLKGRGQIPEHRLVLVGGQGWKDERLKALVADVDQKDVVPLGFVDDWFLSPLYTAADLFLFPSIYEGFGIPVMEARACGTSVLTTDLPETREAGGDDATYISLPPTVETIENGILEALKSRKEANLREEDRPSWDKGARILVEELRAAQISSAGERG